MTEYIIVGAVLFGIGFAIAFWVKGKMSVQSIQAAEIEAGKVRKDAERSAEALLKEAKIEAKDTLFQMKSEFESETKETRRELKDRESRLVQKEEGIDRKAEQLKSVKVISAAANASWVSVKIGFRKMKPNTTRSSRSRNSSSKRYPV